MRAVGLLTCLAALLAGGAGARAEEPPSAEKVTPEALVARWLAAGAAGRPALEAELRRRGPSALAALRAVGPSATRAQRAGVGRIIARIRADWARKHVPEGMVYIPAGPLEVPRASAPWGPSGTRRVVPAFYIDRTEVTVAAWRGWIAALRKQGRDGAREAYLLWTPPEDMPGDLPITRVRWSEARRFAEGRGGRLPSADEFERAMRGSGVSTWPWGMEARAGCANLRGFGPEKTLPVGSHPAGAGPFGVQDLVGNVAEWSSTTVTQGRRRRRYPLVLGGSYRDSPSDALTWRGHDRMRARTGPGERADWLGFRVVRDVPPIPE